MGARTVFTAARVDDVRVREALVLQRAPEPGDRLVVGPSTASPGS